MNTNKIALLVTDLPDLPKLIAFLTEDQEIQYLEELMRASHPDPWGELNRLRSRQRVEESEMEDFVENLLVQGSAAPEVQANGLRWLESKNQLEHYQKVEAEAAQIIVQYAWGLFQKDLQKTDFVLQGPKTQVRVRVFRIPTIPVALSGSPG